MPTQSQLDPTQPRRMRGFAAMDAAKQREIASKGGKAAHESGHAHEFTPEEARIAGRKGGEASGGGHRNRRMAAAASGDGATAVPQTTDTSRSTDGERS